MFVPAVELHSVDDFRPIWEKAKVRLYRLEYEFSYPYLKLQALYDGIVWFVVVPEIKGQNAKYLTVSETIPDNLKSDELVKLVRKQIDAEIERLRQQYPDVKEGRFSVVLVAEAV